VFHEGTAHADYGSLYKGGRARGDRPNLQVAYWKRSTTRNEICNTIISLDGAKAGSEAYFQLLGGHG
jgi:hypothetical protein